MTLVLTLHNFNLGKGLGIFWETNDRSAISGAKFVKGALAGYIKRLILRVENLTWLLEFWITSVVVFMSQIFTILLNLYSIDTCSVATGLVVKGETAHAISTISFEVFKFQLLQEAELLNLVRCLGQPAELGTCSLRVNRQAFLAIFLIVFVRVLSFDFQKFEVDWGVGHITVPAIVEVLALLSGLTLLEGGSELLTSRKIWVFFLLKAEVPSITIIMVMARFTINPSNALFDRVIDVFSFASHGLALG